MAAALPGVGASLRRAIAVCLGRPLVAFGAVPAALALVVVGCLVPLFNFAFLLLGLAPAVGGLPSLGLALVDGRRAVGGRFGPAMLFDGFRRYERFLAVFWVGYLMLMLSAIPLLVALWVDRHLTPAAWRPAVLGVAGVAVLLLAAALLHRYALVFFVAADAPRGQPVSAVLETAVGLLEGRRRAVLGRLAAYAAVGLSGALAFGVGLAVTAPPALAAAAALYRELAPAPAQRPTS